MKIGVDIRVLVKDAQSGVEEYTASLLREMTKLSKDDEFVLFFNAFSKERADFDWIKNPNVSLKEFHLPNQFFNYASGFGFPKIDKMLGGTDVFFSPHFLSAALSKNCKKVMTFHDLSFLRYPEFFPLRKKYWHFLMNIKKQAQKADKIIAISESTKNDLVELYGVDENKIKVIYSGISPEFYPVENKEYFQRIAPLKMVGLGSGFSKELSAEKYLKELKEKYKLPNNFILYLGTIEPRKNIGAIIEAFEIIKENKLSPHDDLKLVIAGGFGWLYKDVLKMAKNSFFANDIIFMGAVEASDRVGIYNLAKLFVFPSFFEGVGFPPPGAMACGVAVINSNCSSLPQTASEGALMIDPYRPEEIAIAAREIFNDEKLRDLLIQKGFEQVKKFSWEKCAKETVEFIRS